MSSETAAEYVERLAGKVRNGTGLDHLEVGALIQLAKGNPNVCPDYALPTREPDVNPERVAQMIAHRACCGTEHDASQGKLHGHCVVCGVPWPCKYVGDEPATREPESGEGGAALIAAERKRQVAEEGWTPEHDNTHRYGEMAKAAAALAVAGTDARVEDPGDLGDPHDPWGLVRKHRRDRVRQLVIAGALIAAEIDREQRLSPSAQSEPEGSE